MGKEIGAMVSVIVGLPLLTKFMFWIVSSTINPSTESIQKGVELIVGSAVPWWLGIMEWLAALPLAGLLILGFILFLKWTGEV